MGGSNFDQIAQALLQQQKVMQDLQEQNNQLRQQLLDLKSGRGISILINGTTFTLGDAFTSTTTTATALDEATPALSTTPSSPAEQEEPISTVGTTIQETTSAEIPVDTTPVAQEQTIIIPSAEQPSTPTEASENTTNTPFLEDLMLSEFTSAMTSPLHTQIPAPDANPQTEQPDSADENDEAKQQADLRRALIGSYVLD
jgi:hypothetical protein